MRLTVDGDSVEVAPGATLLDAVRAAGRGVATLCHDDRVGGGGSCRVCLVGLRDAGQPVPACVTPAADGQVVSTTDADAGLLARGVLELLLSELPAEALDRDSELARACRLHGVTSTAAGGVRDARSRDESHPYITYDPDLCIACGRCVRLCDELQGTFALSLVDRGFATHVRPGAGERWADSPCVACGACVDGCPTGALTEPRLLDPRPVERVVTTTCGYCGTGCTLDVHLRGDEIATIRPSRSSPVNRGHACVKGRFAHGWVRAGDRLTTPLVRRDGELRPASWDEALAFVAAGLTRVRERYGPDAIALVSSARCTNEENYLAQKLARVVVGTNNVDNCSRICHAPSAAGLTRSFGLAGGTHSFEAIDRAGAILLCGANPTEAHPVIGARIKQRAIDGARLVVVDPRRIELAGYADVHLRPRPGTNVALFHGLARVLIDDGLTDDGFLGARAEGLEELRGLLADYDPATVARIAGVPADDIRAAAHLYGGSEGRTIVYGLGVTEHRHGTDGVRALANLAILSGAVGTRAHGGVLPLRGQNNVQGASDMGALPDLLPGYQPLADTAVRARFEHAWGVGLGSERGLRVTELFGAALDGRLRALWVIGEDLAQTDPDTTRVTAALDACELLISQDAFLSKTAARADVVLPAATSLEKDGTFVNFDRRFGRVRPALEPPPGAWTDFEILRAVAAALGADLGCPTPAAALAEVASLCPDFAGLSHERLDREGPLHWPCRDERDPGADVLYLERFATPSGRAALATPHYMPPGEEADDDFPLVLITGRRLEHYNAGTMTRRTANVELLPAERLEINPADAADLDLNEGDLATVTSRRGSIAAHIRTTERVARGQCFLAFHFPDTPTNVLTSDNVDEATSCPEYKVTAVRVRPRDE